MRILSSCFDGAIGRLIDAVKAVCWMIGILANRIQKACCFASANLSGAKSTNLHIFPCACACPSRSLYFDLPPFLPDVAAYLLLLLPLSTCISLLSKAVFSVSLYDNARNITAPSEIRYMKESKDKLLRVQSSCAWVYLVSIHKCHPWV